MALRRRQDDEAAPLLTCPGAVGSARFPFHPSARATPRWRKLLLHFFDGHRRVASLEDRDVWPLEPRLQAHRAAADVERALPPDPGRWRLLRATWRVNRRRLLRMSAWNLLAVVLAVVRPLLLLQVCRVGLSGIDLTTSSVVGADTAVVAPVAGIVVAELALTFVSTHSHHIAFRVSLHARQSLSKMILDKMIVPDPPSPEEQAGTTAAGGRKEQFVRATSAMFSDVDTICYFLVVARERCVFIVRLVVSIAVIFTMVDVSWSLLGGTASMYALVLVIQGTAGQWLMTRVQALHVGWLNTLYDSLKSIQMTKLSAWEDKIQSKIDRVRSEERRQKLRVTMFWLFMHRFFSEIPLLLAAVTFASAADQAYPSSASGIEHPLSTPARIFTALVLFYDCRYYAARIVPGVQILFAGVSAWRRVEAFILSTSEKRVSATVPSDSSISSTVHIRHYLAKMEGACIGSPSRSTSSPALLLDVNWTLKRGDLVVIHGAAGIGKSTLLAALRGDHTSARLMLGSIEGVPSDCRIAYCSQDPWLQTLPIRDNILFGAAFDEEKYWAVVDACGLLEDLVALPAGDATPVGPRGINLSSGQSARIALARACYADADLYLLDCPLANVDGVVQSEIFRKCIVELLMFKTVVIVTHNPEYIGSSFVDQLVEVKSCNVLVTSRFVFKPERKALPGRRIRMTCRTRDYKHERSVRSDASLRIYSLSREADEMRTQIESTSVTVSAAPRKKVPGESPRTVVSQATVSEYFLGGGKTPLLWLLAAALLNIVWMVVSVAKDVLIMRWATVVPDMTADQSVDNSLADWYGYLVLASIVLAVAAAMCLFAFSAGSVDRLFHRTTHALLHATMTFYYQARTGDIVNRYQQDLEVVDKSLPGQLSLLALSAVAFLGRAVVFGWILGPLSVLVTILGYGLMVRAITLHFYQELMQRSFRAQADQLSFLSETLDGEPVLRAFGRDCVARLMQSLEHIHERLARVGYMTDVFNSRTVLQTEAAIAVLLLSLLGILAIHPVSPMQLLLVLFYILTMGEDLVYRFATGLAHTSEGFYNVERLRQFRSMPTEVDTTPSGRGIWADDSWPPHGELTFEQVNFAYTASTEKPSGLALRGVSFTLRGGEKIGVVGRTGSGKSSLAMALLRVHPLRSGCISLDGVDLRTVSLKQLRRSVTMIPQSPTFYRCSVRDYLDPFQEFEDARLWQELLTVELGARVQSLEEELLDNGENWSLGRWE